MAQRKIVTYSTLGDNMREIYSSAATWGDLRSDLDSHGIKYQGMKAMTNPGQVTLESLQAELPQGEFQLFLMPEKVKSGLSDHELVDLEDEFSITWSEEDWSEEDPDSGNFVFRTARDLAIARAKRAFHLLEKAINELAGGGPKKAPHDPSDPILRSLRDEAARLQRNMMFD